LVDNLEIEINLESNETSVVAPISHFSDVHIIAYSSYYRDVRTFFSAEASSTGATVGANPVAEFTINKKNVSISRAYKETSWTTMLTEAGLSGVLMGGEKIEPERFDDRPPFTNIAGDSYKVTANEFTCVKPGKETIKLIAKLRFSTVTTFEVGKTEEPGEGALLTITSPVFECKAKPPAEKENGGVTKGDAGIPIERLKYPETEMSFSHVKPGEYSEVYLSVLINPGDTVQAKLTGPAVEPPADQEIVADDNGLAYFVWRIYSYGEYNATINVEGVTKQPWPDAIVVE
jgi:hypothetical protein